MSSVVISGDTSGSITLSAPAVAGTNTITLPAATGTVQVSGNQPAFSAYSNALQTLSSGSTTKILFAAEDFDTNSNFASSRFTPTVAGYYQLNTSIGTNGGVSPQLLASFYKNGTVYKHLLDCASTTYGLVGSALIYFNGTTDYVEVYVYTQTGCGITGTKEYTWFDGVMVRSA